MDARREAYEQHVVPEIEILLRVALSMCDQATDAEDLVQETLLSAWRGIDGFDGRFPRAWLLTILRNAHRKMHRRQRPSLLKDPDVPCDPCSRQAEASAEEVIVDRAFGDAIDHALRALPEAMRQVVTLVDIDRLTYAETAHALGIPRGTVMSRLHRARSRLRDELTVTGVQSVETPQERG